MTALRLLVLAGALALAIGGCDSEPPPGTPALAPTTLPPSAITPERAVRLAQDHVTMTTVVSVTVGRSADLTGQPGRAQAGPAGVEDLVWAVRFSGEITICNPLGACSSPRPATTTVFLDYATGAFRASDTTSPGR